MLTSVRATLAMGIDETPALAISTPSMAMAMTRKPGNMVHTSREVSVTRYQHTEERGEGTRSRPVLEQREAERSAYRL